MQGHPDGYLVRNIFEGSLIEEGTGAGKAIFEGVFNFSASEARKKLDITASSLNIEEDQSASTSTQ